MQTTTPHSDTIVTPDDITRAYRLARLKWLGIGLTKALTTDVIYRGLHNTAIAMKRRQEGVEHG